MKIRTLLFTLAFILAAIPTLLAKVVTKEQARVVAQNFLTERIISNQVNLNADNLAIIDVTTIEAEGQPAIYVFSNSGNGFILIAADDAITPVLGYSYEGSFSSPGSNSNFEGLLYEYTEQVKFVRNNSMEATPDILNSWNLYISGQFDFSILADTTTVGPLITTMWNQGSPYNEFCPSNESGNALTGCVATAMSMIMNYYKYPITGSGQHSYYAMGYGTQNVNYGATTYDWDAMQNTISNSSGQGIPAQGILVYHAGVSVNMGYGAAASGAYSTDVPYALKTYFKYSPAVQHVTRSGYTNTNWEIMLMEQLDAYHPIYYSGVSPDGGHAWVCDGYQKIGSTKMFHFNFGWGGQENGYFTSLNPNGFTTQQAIIRNIYPNTNYPYGCSSKTLEISKGSIEDGSGPIESYDNNLSCTWLIDPIDSVNSITVSFVRFGLSSSDTLYFYDGADASAPLLAAYSGNNLPTDVSSTGNKLFIQFNTDATVQNAGWLVEFSSDFPSFCSGTKTMTDPVGSFTDGSGDFDYRNNTLCKYKIQPLYAMDLTLTFDAFDLLDEDQILVHSLASGDIIATLSGNQIPDPITVPFGGLYIIFQTNAYYTSGGFSASYSVGNVNTSELPGISSLNVSPNPASDFIMVRAYNSKNQQIELSLNDMTGKNLYKETFSAAKGNIEKSIDVSSLNGGMYFLSMQSTDGRVTQKIIVK